MVLEIIQTLVLTVVVIYLILQRTNNLSAKRGKIVIDSCGLIDGRIGELISRQLITEQIVLPSFVLDELQLLADKKDVYKRERGRYGLEMARQLQEEVSVLVDKTKKASTQTVDDALLGLAKKYNARLYTTDFNLQKRAEIEEIRVFNLNSVAEVLRPATLPGETMKVTIAKRGEGRGQGVGHLPDGTMVIIEEGAKLTGKTVEVVVTKLHQTASGRMMFTRLKRQS